MIPPSQPTPRTPHAKRLPAPSPAQAAHSNAALQTLSAQAHGQILTFDAFMRFALYAPQHGYYQQPQSPFGQSGDFVTAPVRSRFFGQSLAHWCHALMSQAPERAWHLVDWGGGNGALFTDVLSGLAQRQSPPTAASFVDASAVNQQRARAQLREQLPDNASSCAWHETLSEIHPTTDETFIVIANELLDALPVARFTITAEGIQECAVAVETDGLHWVTQAPRPALRTHVNALEQQLQIEFPLGYTSEVHLCLPELMQQLAALPACIALFIDYGYPKREYYLPQRRQGTLMCYHQQHAHDNPLINLGTQDITAHVDFSYVAEAARSAGLRCQGYTNQTAFLLANGLQDFDSAGLTPPQQLQAASELKQLLLGNTMGEAFKVIALSQHLPQSITVPGFTLKDYQHRL